MKLKQLESLLQQVKPFRSPKISLEQYPTTSHLAATMLYTASNTFDDIEHATIIDLGVGCGMLSCAAYIMSEGTATILGVDVDEDALEIAKENCKELEVQMEFLKMDLNAFLREGDEQQAEQHSDSRKLVFPRLEADVVLMNPPFGTKTKGIDMVFLEVASKIATHSIYSLHKTSTRDYIMRKAKSWGLSGQVVAELRYNLDASYKFHKKRSVDIQVDFWRFEKIRDGK